MVTKYIGPIWYKSTNELRYNALLTVFDKSSFTQMHKKTALKNRYCATPMLTDHFGCAEEAVVKDRFYCSNMIYTGRR